MYIKTSEQHKVYITRSTVIQGKEKFPFSLSGLTSLNLVVKNYTWSGNNWTSSSYELLQVFRQNLILESYSSVLLLRIAYVFLKAKYQDI